MTFETLPVVHVERRRLPEYPGADPEQTFTRLARRFGRLALVDVTGVRTNDADLEFLQISARRNASLWVDAGSRYATDAMDLFVAGAETVTLRWNTLHAEAELREASEMTQPGSLFVGLEYPRGAFLRNARDPRSADDVVKLAESLGAGVLYYVDRSDEGFLRSLPPATLRYVQGAAPTAAQALQDMGFGGMLLAPAHLPPEEKAP